MRKRLICFLLAAMLLAAPPAQAAEGDFIRWVDFNLTAEAMERAIALEQRLREKEIPVSWLDILALGSVRSGGKRFSAKDAEKAAAELFFKRCKPQYKKARLRHSKCFHTNLPSIPISFYPTYLL